MAALTIDRPTQASIMPPVKAGMKNLILINDETHDYLEVHEALTCVIPCLSESRAADIVLTTDKEGEGLVGTFEEEYAVFYSDTLLADYDLKTRVEDA